MSSEPNNNGIHKLPYIIKSDKLSHHDIEILCTNLRDQVEILNNKLVQEKDYNRKL